MNLVRYARWVLAGALSLTWSQASAFSEAPKAAELLIEKTVLLMRHGVRSGTSSERLRWLNNRTWPDFGVADGELTAHGRRALILWGQFHRRQLAQQGQLAPRGILSANQIAAFASPLQRTRDSAEAFLEGLSPGSGNHVSYTDTRSWFIPPLVGWRGADPDSVRGAVVEGLGMSLVDAEVHYRPAIQALENALGVPDHRLSEKPWQISVTDENLRVTPVKELATVVETIRMQYANNVPLEDVGFGLGIDQAAIADLLAPRTLFFDTTHNPRFLAVRQGERLLSEISKSLVKDTDSVALSDGVVSLFVGHDGNLAPIRAVLGFHWQVPEHRRNDLNPGAILKFERVRDLRDGERYIRISYVSPTLDQLRNLSPFDDASPPFVVVFKPKSALAPLGGSLIPMQRFTSMVAEVAREAAAESRLLTVLEGA